VSPQLTQISSGLGARQNAPRITQNAPRITFFRVFKKFS